MQQKNCIIPADSPGSVEQEYRANYEAITRGTGRLMLFSADQKIEHLNQDFYGPAIPPETNAPAHLFAIAAQGTIGAFATHLGLMARYAKQYKEINYIVKINGKSNLVPTEQRDPRNSQLWSVADVVQFKKNSELHIRGIGFTIYLGSEYEYIMLEQAAQAVYQAHQHGLVAILWIYPRGKAVKNERDGALIVGAAGLAASLGADFVKINPPQSDDTNSSLGWLALAAQAAGNTKIICSGGKTTEPRHFLQELYDQIHSGHVAGNATGRNILARPLQQAVAMTKAISAITIEGKTVEQAAALLK